ncbi:YlxQ-related RNA-binding protein [Vagococcus silagei]|uniref:YlxQ-related RNA-binding protein n=1 Tax=Vagococcus silagei TaxID=2508885 RepID=A0A4S3B6G5_9ENTE|nr:YlxQ-related RNA-binding protein [Vagococcus silagei]THB62208.1 YlxQ-related RNA-binding protein [Vagococcus silagei]
MTNEKKILNLLGLATRAGKLISGEETTLKAVRQGELDLVIIANDLSDSTIKKMTDKCKTYEVPLVIFSSKVGLSQAIGKSRGILGVKDRGFSRKMCELMEE